jgi:hypothetical protein
MRTLIVFFSVLAWMGGAHAGTPDVVLHGSLTGADHHTYRTEPFAVPDGVARITVEFDYTGKEQRGVIDLGLLGPDGAIRGWSGGNKRIFTISGVDATPSYLPTATRAGIWALLLGVPNLRQDAKADYTAKVYFSKTLAVADEPEVLRTPLRAGAGWYRGDLHSHTGHSDGSCATRSGGKPVPCPLFLTAQAAAQRGLDFIAVTEHNGVAHANGIRELQPYFDQLLLLPGRELTSFFGHGNFFGSVEPIDFRVGGGGQKDWDTVLAGLPKQGLFSINHPVRPSGENCMGCGWDTDVDMRRVQAIEAVNGADADTRYSGIPFWQAQLQRGMHLTAIGGSDNHHADQADPKAAGAIGSPTTVVYSAELSQTAILGAIRAGHVFVDVAGSPDRLLELTARAGGERAMMGDSLRAPAGASVKFALRVVRAEGARVVVLLDGDPAALLKDGRVGSDDAQQDFSWTSDGKRHWLRVDVRSAEGKLLLLGNPIYLN